MAPYTSAPQAPDPFTATRTRMEEMLAHLSAPAMASATAEGLEDYITAAGREVLRQSAASGARRHELVAALTRADSEVVDEEAGDFVDELMNHQVVLPELACDLCGLEPVESLLRDLRDLRDLGASSRAAIVSTTLGAAHEALEALDRRPLGVAPVAYQRIVSTFPELPADTQRVRNLHVDLVKPAQSAVLGADVADEILRNRWFGRHAKNVQDAVVRRPAVSTHEH